MASKSWLRVLTALFGISNNELRHTRRRPRPKTVRLQLDPLEYRLVPANLSTLASFTGGTTPAPYGGLVADRVHKRRLMIVLQSLMAVQALVLGILTVTGAIRGYFTTYTTSHLANATSLLFFNHLQHLRTRFFDEHRVGEIVSRFSDVRNSLNSVSRVFGVHLPRPPATLAPRLKRTSTELCPTPHAAPRIVTSPQEAASAIAGFNPGLPRGPRCRG